MAKKVSANWRKLLFLTLAVVVAAGPETAGAQNAASVYAQKCAQCHGPKGNGDGPAGQVMGLIHDIPTVKVLVDRIVTEAEAIIRGRLASLVATW